MLWLDLWPKKEAHDEHLASEIIRAKPKSSWSKKKYGTCCTTDSKSGQMVVQDLNAVEAAKADGRGRLTTTLHASPRRPAILADWQKQEGESVF